MKYQIEGCDALLISRDEKHFAGRFRVRYITWVETPPQLAPSFPVAHVTLVEASPELWVLQHIIVDVEERRRGWAEKIMLAIEVEHGGVGALWVTPEGQAFARRFIERHGDRPIWRIGTNTKNVPATVELNSLTPAEPEG